MKKLVMILMMVFASANFAWWDTNWQYSQEITYNTTTTEALASFPLRISMNTSNATLWNATTCGNVRFTTSDNITVLPYDIEDPSQCGNSTYPVIFYVGATTTGETGTLYAYLGNVGATSGENETIVWQSANFISSWMQYNSTLLKDSAGRNNLTCSGACGLQFDAFLGRNVGNLSGIISYWGIATGAVIPANLNRTISCWRLPVNSTDVWEQMFGTGTAGSFVAGQIAFGVSTNDFVPKEQLLATMGSTTPYRVSGLTTPYGAWSYIALRINATANPTNLTITFWKNATNSNVSTAFITPAGTAMRVGQSTWSTTDSTSQGLYYGCRLRNQSSSDGWMQAETWQTASANAIVENIGATPSLTIESPTNTTYVTTAINLNYTTNGTGCWYILNGGANQTLASCGNTSITSAEGNNNLTVFANDTSGNTNTSSVYFTVVPVLAFASPTPTDSANNFTYGMVFNFSSDQALSTGNFIEVDGANKSCTVAADSLSCSYTVPYSEHLFNNTYDLKIYANVSGTYYSGNTRSFGYYGCGNLNTANSIQYLIDDISTNTEDCITIGANNTTLDGQGHTIRIIGSAADTPAIVTSTFSTIKNTNIIMNKTGNGNAAIQVYSSDAVISNNNITIIGTATLRTAIECAVAARMQAYNNQIINGTAFKIGLSSTYDCLNATIYSNNITGSDNNYAFSILTDTATTSKIYNNFINKTNHVTMYYNLTNMWNTTLTAGTNVVGGSNIGGNYWGTPAGDGFSDTCTDANGNGICDSTYNVNATYPNEIDYLPLATDTVAPTTTATAIKNSTTGWISYTFGTWAGAPYVNVSLSCNDGTGSGCDKTFYCNDTANTCTPTTLYTTAVQISTEGTSYIRYYSNDTAGNSETIASQTIKVDTTPPTTSVANATKSGGGAYTFGTWANQTINITLNCSDSGAGCNPIYNTYYCNDTANTCTPGTLYGEYPLPFQIFTEGTSYLRYRSYDDVHYGLGYNDGNLETTKNQTIKIDTTAPTTTIVALKVDANPYTCGTWTNLSMASISFTCDDGSGSGCGTILYCNDTVNTCTPTAIYTVPINDYNATGVSYFRYRSNDSVGNGETAKSCAIKIDKDFPYVSIQSPANTTYNTSTPDLNFTATDTSLDKCWYSLDGNASNISITSCANTTVASVADGSHNITVYINDSLGNSNYSATINFSVDTTAPTTTIDFSPYVNNTWTTETIAITLACDDGSGSGCDKILYCIDTADTCVPTSVYSSALSHSANGTSYVRFRSNDSVGNMETAKTRTLRIDVDYLCLDWIAYSTFTHNTSLQSTITTLSTSIALEGNVTYNNTCALALTNYIISLVSKDSHVTCGTGTDCITNISSLASGANTTDAVSAYFDMIATESAISPAEAIFTNLQIQQKTHLYINDSATINVNAVSFQHAFLATSCKLFKCEQETCAYIPPPWSVNLQVSENVQPAAHSNGTFVSNYLQFAIACTDSGLVGGGGGGGGGGTTIVIQNTTNETRLNESEIQQQIITKVSVFPAFTGIDAWLRSKQFGISNALLLAAILGLVVAYNRIRKAKIGNADIIIIVAVFGIVALYWQVFP